MWQSTKELVRQLTEQNHKEFEKLDEKYELMLEELKETKAIVVSLTEVLKSFVRNQTEFNSKVEQMVVGIKGEINQIDKSLDELKQTELVPFISAIENGANMIMVGHMSLPQITGDNTPATMSKEVISEVLRSELGFNGVVITDAMNMGAITEYYGADEAAIRAFKAGADMILMPEDFKLAYEGVIEAVKDGTISEERINNSLKRVYRIKYADSVGE